MTKYRIGAYLDPATGRQRTGIINRQTSQPIPDDEPVFIIRGQDKHAIATIKFYLGLCDHAAMAVADEFIAFQANNPDRVKDPD